jgi:hypothetical protein
MWGFARAQWDRVLGWACVGGGALLVVTGALNVSRAGDQLDQLSYLASGPAIGLFLLGVGAILLVTADLRDEWSKLDEVAALLRRSAPAGASDAGPPGAGKGGEISVTDAAAAPDGDGSAKQPDPLAVRAGVPALAIAALGVSGGAIGARQSLERASAARWTGLSGASLALVVLVAGFMYLRGRRDVSGRMAAVDEALASGDATGGSLPDWRGVAYVVEGSALYHRRGCDLLAFSDAEPIPPALAAGAGLGPCPLCR